ncbi:hypothetical protein JCM11251_004180 [Rhodosporidiobolus azoricus]
MAKSKKDKSKKDKPRMPNLSDPAAKAIFDALPQRPLFLQDAISKEYAQRLLTKLTIKKPLDGHEDSPCMVAKRLPGEYRTVKIGNSNLTEKRLKPEYRALAKSGRTFRWLAECCLGEVRSDVSILLSHCAIVVKGEEGPLRQLAKVSLWASLTSKTVKPSDKNPAEHSLPAVPEPTPLVCPAYTQLTYEPDRPDAHASHLCDRPQCANPHHLIVESSGRNTSRRDCFSGARTCDHHEAPCMLSSSVMEKKRSTLQPTGLPPQCPASPSSPARLKRARDGEDPSPPPPPSDSSEDESASTIVQPETSRRRLNRSSPPASDSPLSQPIDAVQTPFATPEFSDSAFSGARVREDTVIPDSQDQGDSPSGASSFVSSTTSGSVPPSSPRLSPAPAPELFALPGLRLLTAQQPVTPVLLPDLPVPKPADSSSDLASNGHPVEEEVKIAAGSRWEEARSPGKESSGDGRSGQVGRKGKVIDLTLDCDEDKTDVVASTASLEAPTSLEFLPSPPTTPLQQAQYRPTPSAIQPLHVLPAACPPTTSSFPFSTHPSLKSAFSHSSATCGAAIPPALPFHGTSSTVAEATASWPLPSSSSSPFPVCDLRLGSTPYALSTPAAPTSSTLAAPTPLPVIPLGSPIVASPVAETAAAAPPAPVPGASPEPMDPSTIAELERSVEELQAFWQEEREGRQAREKRQAKEKRRARKERRARREQRRARKEQRNRERRRAKKARQATEERRAREEAQAKAEAQSVGWTGWLRKMMGL